MKISEELEKEIIKEVQDKLPKFSKDIDVSDGKIKVTGLCVTLDTQFFIEIEEREDE